MNGFLEEATGGALPQQSQRPQREPRRPPPQPAIKPGD